MTNLILASLAVLIFVVYNAVAIHYFGIPESLSNTFYLYNDKKKGLGYLFTGMMFIVPMLLMPAWINITEVISSWSSYLTVLPFLACASIMFVGAAPYFKEKFSMEPKVHTISAMCAAALSLLWCFVVCYQICYIVPISLLVIAAIAHATKTAKSCLTYWLEMVAFLSTFTTIITECIILL